MTAETGDMYGAGTCAVCRCRIRRGLLMCGAHWRRVPRAEQQAVYAAVDSWQSGGCKLKDLRRAQQAAIDTVVVR